MRTALFTFVKPSYGSKATGHTIARFISEELNVPMSWGPEIQEQRWDVLMLMSGAAAYCDCRTELGSAIENARRVVWIQDDYTCEPTPPDSTAGSPYRRAFVTRHLRGLDIDYWTTCAANERRTEASHLVDWNKLGYEPLVGVQWQRRKKAVIYYGVWRRDRREAFARFFRKPEVPTMISTKRNNEFHINFGRCIFVDIFSREELIPALAGYQVGLYLEDKKSSQENHSPARRFYEMLSAGTAIAFQRESKSMLVQAGLEMDDSWLVDSASDLPGFLEDAEAHSRSQSLYLTRDYRAIVRRQLREAWGKMQEAVRDRAA